jgi:hypothetical protein
MKNKSLLLASVKEYQFSKVEMVSKINPIIVKKYDNKTIIPIKYYKNISLIFEIQ